MLYQTRTRNLITRVISLIIIYERPVQGRPQSHSRFRSQCSRVIFKIAVKAIQMPTVARPVLLNSVTNQDGGYAPFAIKNPAVFLLKAAPAIYAVILLETVFRRKIFVS